MIARIWHGWTAPADAEKYEALLKDELFVGIRNQRIPGLKNVRLLRREIGGEVEFATIMLFDSIDAIRRFAGPNYESPYIPERARAVLLRFDERAQHYEIIGEEGEKT